MELLILAALRGCRDAAERRAVWTAVQSAADDLSCLCQADNREVRRRIGMATCVNQSKIAYRGTFVDIADMYSCEA